jgi:azurin
MRIGTIARAVCALGTLATACGKNESPPTPQAEPAPTAQAAPAPAEPAKPVAEPTPTPTPADKPLAEEPGKQAATAAPAAGDKPTLEVHIAASGITMKFDVTRIAAAPGQTVHVVLENKPPGQLPHNWALVKPGTEASVAAAGLKQGAAAGYMPDLPDVLAHTDMVTPGKTAEVTFTAPAGPGKYPYICTFPGHYMMMKGVLEVAP